MRYRRPAPVRFRLLRKAHNFIEYPVGMAPNPRIGGFPGELLWEFDIAERQLLGIAESIPAETYTWRPHPKARSVSQVLVHIAVGNFMLLEFAGVLAPAAVFGELPPEGQDRLWTMVRRNDQLEQTLHDKSAVTALLKQSLEAVRKQISEMDPADFNRPVHFFNEPTTIRRVFLRMLAHLAEHMGQMTAYLRMNALNPPWPDWRPDRR
jgi:uncharacterized damage-inducible protein DinB